MCSTSICQHLHVFKAILVEPQHTQTRRHTKEFNKEKPTSRAKIISCSRVRSLILVSTIHSEEINQNVFVATLLAVEHNSKWSPISSFLGGNFEPVRDANIQVWILASTKQNSNESSKICCKVGSPLLFPLQVSSTTFITPHKYITKQSAFMILCL